MMKSFLPRCGGLLLAALLSTGAYARVSTGSAASAALAPAGDAVTPTATLNLSAFRRAPLLLAGGNFKACQRRCIEDLRLCQASGQQGCDEEAALCMMDCPAR